MDNWTFGNYKNGFQQQCSEEVTTVKLASGKLYVGFVSGKLLIHDLTTSESETVHLHQSPIGALHVADNKLYTGDDASNMRIVDVSTEKAASLHTFASAHDFPINTIATNDEYLASGSSADGHINIFSLRNKTCERKLAGDETDEMHLLAVGNVLIACYNEGFIQFWNLKSKDIICDIEDTEEDCRMDNLVLLKVDDGDISFATVNFDGVVKTFLYSNGKAKITKEFRNLPESEFISLVNADELLAICGLESGGTSVYSLESSKTLYTIPTRSRSSTVFLATNDSYLACVNDNDAVFVYDFKNVSPLTTAEKRRKIAARTQKTKKQISQKPVKATTIKKTPAKTVAAPKRPVVKKQTKPQPKLVPKIEPPKVTPTEETKSESQPTKDQNEIVAPAADESVVEPDDVSKEQVQSTEVIQPQEQVEEGWTLVKRTKPEEKGVKKVSVQKPKQQDVKAKVSSNTATVSGKTTSTDYSILRQRQGKTVKKAQSPTTPQATKEKKDKAVVSAARLRRKNRKKMKKLRNKQAREKAKAKKQNYVRNEGVVSQSCALIVAGVVMAFAIVSLVLLQYMASHNDKLKEFL